MMRLYWKYTKGKQNDHVNCIKFYCLTIFSRTMPMANTGLWQLLLSQSNMTHILFNQNYEQAGIQNDKVWSCQLISVFLKSYDVYFRTLVFKPYTTLSQIDYVIARSLICVWL